MATENTTTIEIRGNAYEATLVSGWGWPDEAQLAEYVEQGARAENDALEEQNERRLEDSSEYAVLYFVS